MYCAFKMVYFRHTQNYIKDKLLMARGGRGSQDLREDPQKISVFIVIGPQRGGGGKPLSKKQ